MRYKIDQIEGIGPSMSARLANAEIRTTSDLLEKCGAAAGREAVSVETGLSTKVLLKWANMADLMRISGVGEEYSELLEASGVDTVKELRHRNASNLRAKMEEVNDSKRLTRRVPSASQVASWIEQAKQTVPMISH